MKIVRKRESFLFIYLIRFTIDLFSLVDLDFDGRRRASESIDASSGCNYNLGQVFLDEKYQVSDGSKSSIKFKRGQYILKFKIPIPQVLPSSFHYQSNRLHGRIIYSIEVEAYIPGILKRNLKSSIEEIFIRQISLQQVMPLQLVLDLPITSFFCTGRGIVHVATSLDKNIYTPGDRISLKFAIDPTESFGQLKWVTISLIRTICLGNIYERGGADREYRQDERLLGRVKVDNISNDNGEREVIERRAILSIPESEPYTIQGKLIECKYELVFRVKTAWSYISVSKYPITVLDSHLPKYKQ